MDVALATTIVAARTTEIQIAIAAKMLRMNADTARSAVKIIDAAQDNFERMVSVAPGIGENLDISV